MRGDGKNSQIIIEKVNIILNNYHTIYFKINLSCENIPAKYTDLLAMSWMRCRIREISWIFGTVGFVRVCSFCSFIDGHALVAVESFEDWSHCSITNQRNPRDEDEQNNVWASKKYENA